MCLVSNEKYSKGRCKRAITIKSTLAIIFKHKYKLNTQL